MTEWAKWAEDHTAQPEGVDPDNLDSAFEEVRNWFERGDTTQTLDLSERKVGFFASLPHRATEIDISDNRLPELPALSPAAATVNASRNLIEDLPDDITARPALKLLDVSENPLHPDVIARIREIMDRDGYNGPVIVLPGHVQRDAPPSAALRNFLAGKGFQPNEIEDMLPVLNSLRDAPALGDRGEFGREFKKIARLSQPELEGAVEVRLGRQLGTTRGGRALLNVSIPGNPPESREITTLLSKRQYARLKELSELRNRLRTRFSFPIATGGMTAAERNAIRSPQAAEVLQTVANALSAAWTPPLASAVYEGIQAFLNEKHGPDGEPPAGDNEHGYKHYPRLQRGLPPRPDETAFAYVLRLTHCVDPAQVVERYPYLAEAVAKLLDL